MASTHRSWTPNTTRTLFLIAMSATTGWGALSEMTYKGCFSSSQPLKDQGPWTYQTSGYCQPICVKANQAVLALSDGSHCWCGSELPATDSQVDDSKCNEPCNGYDSEMCGGDGYYSVYLSGTEDNVPSYGGSGGSSHAQPDSDSSPSSSSTPTTTRPPTVVTSVSPGRTIVITKPAEPVSSSSSTPTPESDTSGGSTNVAGIAAGVVVGVVAAVAIVTALFFWLRHRRRTAAEEEYKRTQVADFMRGGERKPPPTGYSTTSDSRLDPEAGNRRDSHGSIADDQDFSRRILRVANPDK